MTLGQRIKAARIAVDLTQAELAKKLGVSDKAVSGWERDQYSPESKLLPRIRDVLGITYDLLIDGEERRSPMDDITPAERAALEAYLTVYRQQHPLPIPAPRKASKGR